MGGLSNMSEEIPREIEEECEEEDNIVDRKNAVVEDLREHVNIVFIGHVDAGKSTIAGNVLYLTGMVDERTIQKYEKEAKDKKHGSWFLAFIMDTNEEERAKGKTVEVGRAHFSSEKKRYTILDAPGHKNYVPNMIGGAAQADIGILVISARQGEFEAGFEGQGQTREHTTLAKTLGVRQLIILVNKMDEQSVNWSKDRFAEIQKKFTPFLKSVGYNPKTDVLGKLESGTLKVGNMVTMMPNKQTTEVVSLELDETGMVDRCSAGEIVTVGLKDISAGDISQGFVLCSQNEELPVMSEFEAQLVVIDLLPTKPIMSAGYSAVIHVHTCTEEVIIDELLSTLNRKTKKASSRKPVFVKKGDIVTVRISVARPICCELFEKVQQLGRFTLRDEGKTIAIGKITKIVAQQSDG